MDTKKHIFIANKEQEINLIESGKYLNEIVHKISEFIIPGNSTQNLEDKAKELFKSLHVKPAFLGLYDFPAILCTSINEECVHGIPSSDKIIKEGDIVTIDCGAIYKGMYSDMAISKIAGNPKNIDDINLVNTTFEILHKQIDYIEPGVTNLELAIYTEDLVRKAGYKVIKNLGGHGLGDCAHCDPFIANAPFDQLDEVTFKENMVIAIEPIISINDTYGRTPDESKWVVISDKGSQVAHFEHTIIIKKDGAKILTL